VLLVWKPWGVRERSSIALYHQQQVELGCSPTALSLHLGGECWVELMGAEEAPPSRPDSRPWRSGRSVAGLAVVAVFIMVLIVAEQVLLSPDDDDDERKSDAAVALQWSLAGQSVSPESALTGGVLETYLYGAYRDTFLQPKGGNIGNNLGVYQLFRGTCTGYVGSVRLVYVRVWKGGNDTLCRMLKNLSNEGEKDPGGRRLFKQSPSPPTVVFTFVRDPLNHFISGYSEIEYRTGHKRVKDIFVEKERGRFFGMASNTVERARAFIVDFVGGRLGGTVLDGHAFPQIAFLSRARPLRGVPSDFFAVDFVGKLENFDEDWCALGHLAALKSGVDALSFLDLWPPTPERANTHQMTDSHSGNTARKVMEEILDSSSSDPSANLKHLIALCRVLLPDYVCFRYALPPPCAAAIGQDHGVRCLFGVDLPASPAPLLDEEKGTCLRSRGGRNGMRA
jgi:hypothetical protein